MKTKIFKAWSVVFATIFIVLAVGGGETNLPIVSVYTTTPPRPGIVEKESGPRIVVAAWDDGRIVWSKSPIEGGSPYLQGHFHPEKLAALLTRLEQAGAFTNSTMSRPWFGPDAAFTTISISAGRHHLKMESWHELYEMNTNVVASARGLESLKGRNREEVLREQSEEYRQFRQAWSEIRQSLRDLIPATGESYGGQVPLLRQ